MKKIMLIAAAVFGCAVHCSSANIHLAGDSTCATRNPPRKFFLNGRVYRQTGWGEVLNKFCKDEFKVCNLAAGARSSKSFIAEGRWKNLLNGAKPGDYVVVQFGHNDNHQGPRKADVYTNPETTYKDFLRIYAKDAKAKKLNLIFATPVPCCKFNKAGKVVAHLNLPAYRKAMLEVGKELGIPVVDLYQAMSVKLEKIGEVESQKFYMFIKVGEYPNLNLKKDLKDCVHLQEAGALEVAKTFTEECKRIKLDIAKCFK